MQVKAQMFSLLVIITILSFLDYICAKKPLLPCSEVMQELCAIQDYISTINPDPIPTEVNITLIIQQVLNVDEKQEIVSLSMKALLEWQDKRLDVNRSKTYIEK